MVRQALKLSAKYLKSRATVYFDKLTRHLIKAGHIFGLLFFKYKMEEGKASLSIPCDNSTTEEKRTALFHPWTHTTLRLEASQNILFMVLFLYCFCFYSWNTVLYIHAKWNLFKSLPLVLIQKQTHRTPWRQKLLFCSCIIKNRSAPWQYSQHSLSWHLKLAMRAKRKSFWSPTAPIHQFKPHYVLVPVIIPPNSLCWKRSQAE